MLVKPPDISPKPIELSAISRNNDIKQSENPISMVNDDTTKELQFIRKKKEYRTFIKLVKEGKFTTAIMSAKLLKVQPSTIIEWLGTKKVRACMDNQINSYIKDIEVSKDWKAKAYLLDKITNTEHTDSTNNDVKQLIVINT